MNILPKLIAISGLALLTACGAKSETPKTTEVAPEATVEVSPELAYIDIHIDAMNNIADELNLINANTDAHRYKISIAKSMVEMYNSKSKYEGMIDETKAAQLMMTTGRLQKHRDAAKRMGEAMKRITQEQPEAYQIVAVEINKAIKLNR